MSVFLCPERREYMNKKEFDLSGVTTWHELGYTGKGIRIANLEGTDPTLHFFNGKLTAIVEPLEQPGTIKLEASAKGVKSASIDIITE